MMNSLRVAALQMGPASQTAQAVLERMLKLIEDAGRGGAQIVCFPELAFTPYFPSRPLNTEDREKYFEELPSERIEPLLTLARVYRLGIILPYAEKAAGRFYNSALIIDGEGHICGKYRKIHLPLSQPDSRGKVRNYEDQYFRSGDLGIPVFSIDGVKIGVQICYDRHFPEGFRVLALQGAEVVFLPTNSPSYGLQERRRLWEALLTVRAYENGIFLVVAAKAGVENGIEYLGGSSIVSPRGDFLAQAKSNNDEIVLAELNLDLVLEARKDLPFQLVRRPECYQLLCKA
ncbi:MAG: carbon-nitrogen hydrolase family protein [Moorella humiferrea]|nr:carbon-nitrogen hydrolase family protein [Moorella humiferrea]